MALLLATPPLLWRPLGPRGSHPGTNDLGCLGVSVEPSRDDDHELVERANRGDEAAFVELYERHRGWAASVAYRFTGNGADTLDVVQEVFAYLYGKFPGFELTTNLRGFLYPAVKHLALGRKPKEALVEEYAELAERRLAVPPETPDEVQRLVAALPDGQREVVWMRFVDDMKLKEIALALDVPLGTVKSRLHLALKALKGSVAGTIDAPARREAGS